jgi:hypothetical protein
MSAVLSIRVNIVFRLEAIGSVKTGFECCIKGVGGVRDKWVNPGRVSRAELLEIEVAEVKGRVCYVRCVDTADHR